MIFILAIFLAHKLTVELRAFYSLPRLGFTGKEPNHNSPLVLRIIILLVSSTCTPLILPGSGDGRPVRPASLLAVLGFSGVDPETPQIPF